MIKRTYFYLLTLALLFTGTGCWDLLDINDRAYITTIGLDKPANPLTATGEIPNRYKVTAEILLPNLFKESASRLERNKETASVIYTAEGETIQKAIDDIQARVPFKISLAHFNILIIGEDLARESLKNPLDYFKRNPDVARRLRVFFAHNSEAKDIFKLKPQFSQLISMELITPKPLDLSMNRYEPFSDILKEMYINNGISLGARLFLSDGGESVTRHGACVFKDWKLFGWLSKDETRHANWFVGKGESIVVGQSKDEVFSYYIEKRKLKIQPKVENNELSFMVNLKTQGVILQKEGNHMLSEIKDIRKLEELFNKVIEKEVKHAIHKAQKDLQTDYLGFGMKLYNKYPQMYKSLDWEETFPNVPINVQVEATISSFGQAR
ncbi:MAG: Ger(x)C family spore germination protein [Peptococcales bacterium]|jgi:spore germination protein KC